MPCWINSRLWREKAKVERPNDFAKIREQKWAAAVAEGVGIAAQKARRTISGRWMFGAGSGTAC